MPRKYKDHAARVEAAQKVCEIVAQGVVTQRACTEAGVAFSTFMYWTYNHDDIQEMWDASRKLLLESWADDVIEIAENGEFTYKDKNDEIRVDNGAVNLAKLQIDARKWLLSKLHPEVYGEKLQHKNDPDNPITGAIVIMSSEHDKDL